MWLANYEDGGSVSEINCYWTAIPSEKKLTAVQLVGKVAGRKFYVCLRNYHQYYFAKEALATQGEAQGNPTAEILGGIDQDLGVGTEIRVEVNGGAPVARVTTFSLDKFRYSKEILREGKVNGKPKVETAEPASEM